jgi:hypothetical protein
LVFGLSSVLNIDHRSQLSKRRPDGSDGPGFVDAIEIAKILGRDVSTPEAVHAARKHVYDLANLKRIPSIRPTPRRMVFDPVAVRKALKNFQQDQFVCFGGSSF